MSAPPNFDRVAHIYRWAEYLALGPLLQRARNHFLPQLDGCRTAFVLGDGDGRFVACLLAENPGIQTLAVDSSSSMLRLLRRRCSPHASRLTTWLGDARKASPAPGTDLIVTHFFLDCLTQIEVNSLAVRLSQEVEPGTLWLLSDFRVPQRAPLRPLAAAYIRLLYWAFRILTGLRVTSLPNPQAALHQAGFRLLAEHYLLGGILYTQLWQLARPDETQLRRASPHLFIQTMNETPTNSTQLEERFPADALPDPEPAVPSLDAPDPGVFLHEPAPARNPKATKDAGSQ